VFSLPVILALLAGLNLLVWAQHRINYPFIFGTLFLMSCVMPYSHLTDAVSDLDGRTRLDYRQYFEVQAFKFHGDMR
jgi:hypothetical protein